MDLFLSVHFVHGMVTDYHERVGLIRKGLNTNVIQSRRVNEALLFGTGAWHDLRKRLKSMYVNTRNCADVDTVAMEHESEHLHIPVLTHVTSHSPICLLQLIESLVLESTVIGVEIDSHPKLLNYAAKGVVQSGTEDTEPFTSAGLQGAGHVVGVADSGLDDLSCFFLDTSGQYSSIQTSRSPISSPVTEINRRKVVQYVANADGLDDTGGHGTHVCGSIAGQSLESSFSAGDGVQPQAKIAFFDLQTRGSPYVSVPDLYQYVFKSAYSAGARVFSHSWGSSSSGEV